MCGLGVAARGWGLGRNSSCTCCTCLFKPPSMLPLPTPTTTTPTHTVPAADGACWGRQARQAQEGRRRPHTHRQAPAGGQALRLRGGDWGRGMRGAALPVLCWRCTTRPPPPPQVGWPSATTEGGRGMRGAALPVLLVVQALRWGGQALRQGVGGGGGEGVAAGAAIGAAEWGGGKCSSAVGDCSPGYRLLHRMMAGRAPSSSAACRESVPGCWAQIIQWCGGAMQCSAGCLPHCKSRPPSAGSMLCG